MNIHTKMTKNKERSGKNGEGKRGNFKRGIRTGIRKNSIEGDQVLHDERCGNELPEAPGSFLAQFPAPFIAHLGPNSGPTSATPPPYSVGKCLKALFQDRLFKGAPPAYCCRCWANHMAIRSCTSPSSAGDSLAATSSRFSTTELSIAVARHSQKYPSR